MSHQLAENGDVLLRVRVDLLCGLCQ